ncbi:MAG: hypothetical protein PUD59_04730 [bacterium]|nr:hypothetical protein [bacterium]
MGNEQRFLVVKNKDEKTIKYFEYNKIGGYKITPKKNVKFEDAINVNKMILINPSLIEKMIDKKVKRKLDYLINMMSIVCDSDDDNADGLYLALDEVEKFKMEVINKYKKYVEEEKMEMLMKKISILEDELNLRIKYMGIDFEKEKEGKSR